MIVRNTKLMGNDIFGVVEISSSVRDMNQPVQVWCIRKIFANQFILNGIIVKPQIFLCSLEFNENLPFFAAEAGSVDGDFPLQTIFEVILRIENLKMIDAENKISTWKNNVN